MSFIGQKDDNDNDDDSDEDGVKPSDQDVGSVEIHDTLSTPVSSSKEPEVDETGDQGDATHEKGDFKVGALKADGGQEANDMVLVSEDAHSRKEKSVEGNVIYDEQVDKFVDDSSVDVNVALPEEVSSVVEEPSVVDFAERLEFPDQKSTEHEPTSSKDQVAVIALEKTEAGPALDLQRSEDETKRQEEEETKQEVSAVETVEESFDVADKGGEPSLQVLDDAPGIVREMVSKANEHQAGIKEEGSSLERIWPDNADSVAELEKVKRDMKLMTETALLGAARQAQVEENKVESIKKDKAATEKLLQETIEKNQAELVTQKGFYTDALTAPKEAESLAESLANDEAGIELESRLKESLEHEVMLVMLVQTLEELRQTLSRNEQQAAFREDTLRRDIEDLQKRYQESEHRCEESTRPLLRHIEALNEITARKADAWNALERSLNLRLQEAEAKVTGAEQKESAASERLSLTISRINVLEIQVSLLRTEQTRLTRSLERERQRAAESRQDYLALKEEADTHEGHVSQLKDEIRELKQKHKQELHKAFTHHEFLWQDIEREKTARLELEKAAYLQSSAVLEQNPIARTKSSFENERRNPGEATMSSYHLKSKPPNAFEDALRQKEDELAFYMKRLASMESIRDSLALELVGMTAECEELRSEVSQMPGLKAELTALESKHNSALELLGEQDEELEKLRADIVDMKEMYREQVNILTQ